MRICIAEDATESDGDLQRRLRDAGFNVVAATNQCHSAGPVGPEEYDLLIIDVSTKMLDPRECTSSFTGAGGKPRCFALTTLAQRYETVNRLHVTFADCLIKPFVFPELLDRIQGLCRSGSGCTGSNILYVADLTLDVTHGRVVRGTKTIDLTPKELGMLELLMKRQGQVVERSLLASEVWGMNFEFDSNAIEAAIRRLRGKIDESQNVGLIHTVRGMGYVLQARAVSRTADT